MSLLPQVFGRDFWDIWDYPQRLIEQEFGDILPSRSWVPWMDTTQPRPVKWRTQRSLNVIKPESAFSTVINDPNQFQVQIDCKHFAPNELTVKTTGDSLIITGKHEEIKDEHGFISREFTRRYLLPKEVDTEKISSQLDANGVLTLAASRKQLEPIAENERVIPIAVTVGGTQQAIVGGGNAEVAKSKEQVLEVKFVDNSLVISGKHDEKEDDYGFMTRKFTGRYLLPKDIILTKMKSSLASTGVLTVTAPKKQAKLVASKERVIPIAMADPNTEGESKKDDQQQEGQKGLQQNGMEH